MQRLFLRSRLTAGAVIDLDRGQANYLANVLRMNAGAAVRVFNGRDGEWQAVLTRRDRRGWALTVESQERPQDEPSDLYYLFAPLKQARLDYMVQKAVEMGAGVLAPVLTQYAQVNRVNTERMEANAIEAAEQCGLLSIPQIDEPVSLFQRLETWPAREPGRRIIYCDEASGSADPINALNQLKESKFAVLVGPEGGFSPDERSWLRSRPFVTAIGLGPRIMRADTAAVAALALVQAVLGDWRAPGNTAT
jgi:16S rRNA (uracil1498-N3)-methyltransferase